MRYRDQPTVEANQRLSCGTETAWRYVTDITLPARVSTELDAVEWLDGADHVAVGAQPDKEARIVARRLDEWLTNMRANLAYIAEQTGGSQ